MTASTRITHGLLVLVLLALLTIIGMLAAGVRGGPLDPPGPLGPTAGVRLPGTPISSLPLTISQPGNYYLTGNLTAAGTGHGITVTAPSVTIDLNGFALDGANIGNTGIFTDDEDGPDSSGLTVRNGTVTRWDSGIIIRQGGRVERVNASANSDLAIRVTSGTVVDCVLEGNAIGVMGNGSVVSNCSATGNGRGFLLSFGSTLRGCTTKANTVAGIEAEEQSLIEGCASTGDQVGIILGNKSTARGNSVSGSRSDGILVPFLSLSASVVDNHTTNNGTGGFGAGISVIGGASRVSRNNVTWNNGPGIYVDASYNTIDENSSLNNDGVGITVIGGVKNTVVRNTAVGNLGGVNFSIVAGNNPGTVITANTTSDWSNTQ